MPCFPRNFLEGKEKEKKKKEEKNHDSKITVTLPCGRTPPLSRFIFNYNFQNSDDLSNHRGTHRMRFPRLVN